MKRFYLIVLLFGFLKPVEIQAQHSNADSLIAIAQNLNVSGEFKTSLEYFEQALPLYLQQKDSISWFKYSIEYADVLISAGDVIKALGYFQSLDSLNVGQVPFDQIAKVKRQIGYCYRQLEQYDKAEVYYLEGMVMAREVADSSVMAYFHNNLGIISQKRGDYTGAHRHLTSALKYFEAKGNESMAGNVLNGIFLNIMNLELYKEAEPYIKRSLAIQKKLQNLRQLDIAYHNMGWNYHKQGQIDSAIIFYQKSLELTRQLGNPYEITYTLNQIGNLFASINDFNTAHTYYQEALQIESKLKRPLSEAKILISIAINHKNLGNPAGSNKMLQEALQIYQDLNVPHELVNLLRLLADYEHDIHKARTYLQRARNIALEYELNEDLNRIRNRAAQLFMEEGKWRQGISELKEVHKTANSRPNILSAVKNLARSYHHLHSDSAFYYADLAFDHIQNFRTDVAGLTFRSGLFQEHSKFYNEVAGWYVSQKYDPAKAFELIEAASARVMMDQLAKANEFSSSRLSEQDLILKHQKINNINRLYTQLEKAFNEDMRRELEIKIRDAEFDYQAFINVVNLENTAFKNISYPQPLTLPKAQALLDEESAILQYSFSNSALLSLFITPDNIKVIKTDSISGLSAMDYLSGRVNALIHNISSVQSTDSIHGISTHLYNILAEDFLPSAPNVNKLLIVSSGPLSILPFEVLMQNQSYLVEHYMIKYAPSVSSIPFIQDPHRSEGGLMAIAGSGLDVQIPNPTRSSNLNASLPSALMEVESIITHFKDASIYKNNSITETELKSLNLSTYKYLHFATHGQINWEEPSRSGLLISNTPEEIYYSADDGFLNSREISLLDLKADLVVLSACKTGLGKNISGEGLLGLQRSFLIAGASAVVVSLWDIYDRSTSVFMDDFYKKILNYEDAENTFFHQSLEWLGLNAHPLFDYKTRALRDTKISMIHHPYYNHPVYWASFVLVGK